MIMIMAVTSETREQGESEAKTRHGEKFVLLHREPLEKAHVVILMDNNFRLARHSPLPLVCYWPRLVTFNAAPAR